LLLSVIIVNYNVKHFLEQCLCSVQAALAGYQGKAEVFVVDNNSTDGSVAWLRERFPFVNLIVNTENAGFGKANNQALQLAKGRYVLFLNPDTILPEDIFIKTIAFMDAHPQAGALGVRMVDGSGRFLKESMRGLPTPWASFCKMTGLTGLFPRSALFAGYYLGHQPENKTQPADVQSGAFFLAPRRVLEKTGGFDEQFFMYAEDIDLSYRILKAGYQNYYFADADIIHFKGESTRKDARYVKLFYKAMVQFVRKHYQTGSGAMMARALNAAIRLRSGLARLQHGKSVAAQTVSTVKIEGDYATASGLSVWLQQKNIAIKPDADTVVFCQGKEYSFKQMIAAIQSVPPGVSPMVHASGTQSVIGSSDRNQQGLVLTIESF
jgi:N-acetylglucosaminyl-diphospho-decaprenol L-rhamnosyltransferase